MATRPTTTLAGSQPNPGRTVLEAQAPGAPPVVA
jgi:hypothetical protein